MVTKKYLILSPQFCSQNFKKNRMANHKSAEKRIRQNENNKIRNRYYSRSARNAIKELRNTTDKKIAAELFPKVAGMLDKLAKMNIIHLNKDSNLKSSLSRHVNSL